jgi:flagellar basal-body rod protein FlgB
MADINGILSSPTIQLLHDAMKGAGQEHIQIANNIANAETPNFRRGTTSFREELAASLGAPADPDEMTLATDDDRQFAVNGAVAPVPFDPQSHVDETTQMRVDKSNVDIDQEMAQLQMNSGYKQSIAGILQKEYSWIREAIQEQPN